MDKYFQSTLTVVDYFLLSRKLAILLLKTQSMMLQMRTRGMKYGTHDNMIF